MPATSLPPRPGRKPRSRPATRDATRCSTLNPFHSGRTIPLLSATARAAPEPRAILTAIEAGAAPAEQLLHGEHRLGVAQIASDRGDALARDRVEAVGHQVERFLPLGLDQPAAAPDIGAVEPAMGQPIVGEA